MSGNVATAYAAPIAIPSEHGLLYGQLDRVPGAAGLVVLAHASATQDRRESRLAERLREFGLSTLVADLLARREERYADVRHNVPLLAKRLLEFLAQIKIRMQHGELESQPLALYAARAASPVVVRVAALRDHDIAAVVCDGGLIDLAGMLYLHSLEAPLLLLVEETDGPQVASGERALRELKCVHELMRIPENGIGFAASNAFEVAATHAAQWFVRHIKAAYDQAQSLP